MHEIHACHLLGDGVLDLQAGVGLDEDERLLRTRLVDEELERAEARVAFLLSESDGRADDAIPDLLRERRRRGNLDDLLVAALNTALALAEVRHGTGPVAEDLHLDVAGVGDELLDVDVGHAEGGLRLGLATGVGGLDLGGIGDDAGAPPPAPGDGLDDHRSTVERGHERTRFVERDGAVEAAQNRYVGGDCRSTGTTLVAEQFEMFGVGTDEDDACRITAAGETGAFGEEAVARMDGLASGGRRGVDNRLFVEVRRRALIGERVGLVGHARMQARGVVLRVDRHCAQAEVGGRSGNADGNLAAVGDQQSVEAHGVSGWWLG